MRAVRSLLIVEDDTDASAILADRFRFEGYEVTCAANGSDAWLLFVKGFRPDAMILDVMLPGIDGVALRNRMLTDPELARIPIFVVTAVGGMVRASLQGVAGFFRKPVPLEPLVESVGAQLTRNT
jgi:DNA-binding response OmpR family regulator